MATVVHKVTGMIAKSVNTPDYSPTDWLILNRANISLLPAIEAIPEKYRKFNGTTFIEADAGEKAVVDAKTVTLVVASDGTPDFDGVPTVNADGAAVHTITVTGIDGSGKPFDFGKVDLRVVTSVPVAMSTSSPQSLAGVASFTVGPSMTKVGGDVTLKVYNPAGTLISQGLTIRFK